MLTARKLNEAEKCPKCGCAWKHHHYSRSEGAWHCTRCGSWVCYKPQRKSPKLEKNKISKYDICGRPVSLRQYTRIRLTELYHLHQRSIDARAWQAEGRKQKLAWEVCWETEHSCEDIISLLQDFLKDQKWGRGIEWKKQP